MTLAPQKKSTPVAGLMVALLAALVLAMLPCKVDAFAEFANTRPLADGVLFDGQAAEAGLVIPGQRDCFIDVGPSTGPMAETAGKLAGGYYVNSPGMALCCQDIGILRPSGPDGSFVCRYACEHKKSSSAFISTMMNSDARCMTNCYAMAT
ncbi:hypothetical protein H696_05165 [Fonticula alba]|uniref:WSC domain-containing protein n=1 Tax=Fonticula alba TaxID=691883 RepID=A0A058Z3X7_FONAL|nr:hypothetical protein H696_05165 [Fonticula alba]KCV68242.1 hypothetical protein H696_05165 [Fonticula alba]|eukprot:XP_009497296.1 hypothetical protein H696_05165 [Fonticula alba]